MSKLEKLTIELVTGFIMPVLLMLAGWWGSLGHVPENRIKYFALSGFILGIILDAVFLGRWVDRIYSFSAVILVAVYMFYTIGIFGFFMGVPVFNILPGILAGAYIGRRMLHQGAGRRQFDEAAKKVYIFTTLVIIAVSAASAAIALVDPYTSSNLKGMLGLGFEVTLPMVYALIAVGGAALIILQYRLAKFAAYKAYGRGPGTLKGC